MAVAKDAFTGLVDAYYASLYRFAYSLSRNETDAGDLTQQTFYIWATKGHTLHDVAKAKSWLFTTLHREFLRTRRRDQRWMFIEDLPIAQTEIPAEAIDQLRQLDGAAVMSALASVEEIFRAPLTLFYLENFSYLEIAETLGIPPGTVMSRLSRGKTQLRNLLATAEARPNIVPFDASRTRGKQQP